MRRATIRQASTALILLLISNVSATGEDAKRPLNLPATPFAYAAASLPKQMASDAKRFDNTPPDNPITNHGATLGRVLFYDTKLSRNGTTSCASCHKQAFAFSDDRKVSVGFDGRKVARNSMSLINLRYYARGRMFWDERAETLEQQVLMPIENEIEMGHDLDQLVPQLQADPIYPPLFKAAFGRSTVSKKDIARALAQFVRSIVSFRSPYDLGRAQVESVEASFPNFSEQENYGKEIFLGRARCAECHLEGLENESRQSSFFFVAKPVVNGVDSDVEQADAGVADDTKQAVDRGKFKVPSLRNIQVTGPYMHDGRFHTLDQVIEHYNWSVRPHPNLDPRLEDFAANGLALPEVEKVALTAFLLTLTDQALLNDERFSDPFEQGER